MPWPRPPTFRYPKLRYHFPIPSSFGRPFEQQAPGCWVLSPGYASGIRGQGSGSRMQPGATTANRTAGFQPAPSSVLSIRKETVPVPAFRSFRGPSNGACEERGAPAPRREGTTLWMPLQQPGRVRTPAFRHAGFLPRSIGSRSAARYRAEFCRGWGQENSKLIY